MFRQKDRGDEEKEGVEPLDFSKGFGQSVLQMKEALFNMHCIELWDGVGVLFPLIFGLDKLLDERVFVAKEGALSLKSAFIDIFRAFFEVFLRVCRHWHPQRRRCAAGPRPAVRRWGRQDGVHRRLAL